jgi:NAD(P)-dependent dehydrogenase (short-subunit alcohol dehydrogenase family)
MGRIMQSSRRTVVVTGGGTGIGLAIAASFGRAGDRVAICGRREGIIASAVEQLSRDGATVFGAPCDVSVKQQVGAFYDRVRDRFGAVDVLVNNAAISQMNSIRGNSDEVWHQIISVNLNGMYYSTAAALASMPSGGRIVNISSILGKVGGPGYSAYCTSKHGIIGFTRAAALELAAKRITVNAVCPGLVDTDMSHRDMTAEAIEAGVLPEEYWERAIARIPLGRIIAPDEVAELVFYLCSDLASSITGEAYTISGGEVMQ